MPVGHHATHECCFERQRPASDLLNCSRPHAVAWLGRLKDWKGKSKILVRLDRVEQGNFGAWGSVGNGVYELKIDSGPGYRVYYGLDGDDVVLLGGGAKNTQSSDIDIAIERWEDYNA